MIAVDTSALMAVLLDEPETTACAEALSTNDRIMVSAGTVAEALIDGLGLEIVSVTLAVARRVAESYAQWGKGVNPAGLNFGDCFAHEVAKTHDCPLLYVGGDFARTDVASVL